MVIVYTPCRLVVPPLGISRNTTVAPPSGLRSESVTLPVIVACCCPQTGPVPNSSMMVAAPAHPRLLYAPGLIIRFLGLSSEVVGNAASGLDEPTPAARPLPAEPVLTEGGSARTMPPNKRVQLIVPQMDALRKSLGRVIRTRSSGP